MFQQQIEIRDLASEEARASATKWKLNKTKAFVKPTGLPRHVYNVQCIGVPQDIYVGQNLDFEVFLETAPSSGTETPPEIILDSCIFTLVAQTGGLQPTHIEVLRQKARGQRPKGPFSNDNGFRKTIDLGTFAHIPSTFAMGDISQSYKLIFELFLHAGNHDVVMKREFPIVVHSDAERRSLEEPAPPTYEEVMAGTRTM